MKDEIVQVIVKHLDADMTNLQDYKEYFVNGDVTVGSVFLMVEESIKIAIKETIETAKCHCDDPDSVDWEGTEINTLSLLGLL